MRLSELKGIKTDPGVAKFKELTAGSRSQSVDYIRQKGLQQFGQWLTKKGFKTLGSGAFGLAFTHPNLDYVIKVFKDDKPYIHFINYCKNNPGNPHLPKFRGNLIKIDDDHFAIRLEKLTFANTSVLKCFVSFLSAYADTEMKPDKFLKLKRETLDDAVLKLVYEQGGALITIYNLRKDGKYIMDLHDKNMMMRGNIVVITDPWYQ